MPYISTDYMQQREVLIISLDLAISSVIESESYVRGGATHSEIVLVLTNLLQKYARELHRRERNAKDPDINNPDCVNLTDEDVVAEAARAHVARAELAALNVHTP